ncbi:MAG TPA: hypothetical protein VFJ14_13175 [Nocardioidaceae bacterium]|nr:hypothetical protein [Nocardioidaceae bacterium]
MTEQPDDTARLVARLAEETPPFSSLGTPMPADTELTDALVRRGPSAVPALLDGLATGNTTIAMYSAYCLGLIGDATCIPALLAASERYRTRERHEQSDYGVVGAAEEAVRRLSAAGDEHA